MRHGMRHVKRNVSQGIVFETLFGGNAQGRLGEGGLPHIHFASYPALEWCRGAGMGVASGA